MGSVKTSKATRAATQQVIHLLGDDCRTDKFHTTALCGRKRGPMMWAITWPYCRDDGRRYCTICTTIARLLE